MSDATERAIDAFEAEAKAGGFWDKIICMKVFATDPPAIIKPRASHQHDHQETPPERIHEQLGEGLRHDVVADDGGEHV